MKRHDMLRQRRRLAGGATTAALVMCSCIVSVAFAEDAPKHKATGAPLNLLETHRDAYAEYEKPTLVDIREAHYLTVAGKGPPGGPEFVKKVGTLYGIAYTLKMKSKFAGRDYSVAPLEGLWWGSKDDHDFFDEPRESWNWKLLIRTPDFVTEAQVREAAEAQAAQRGDKAAKAVGLEKIAEGRSVQMLHVGPYATEVETIAAMTAFMASKGLVQSGYHHEIYLSDPNRTDPEKLRTILRLPVESGSD